MTARKVTRILNRIVDYLVFVIMITCFLIGSYALYDSYLVYKEANPSTIMKWRPGVNSPAEERGAPEDMVAWLTMDDTTIDYPIMQGKDNHEYLNKNPYGEYSLAGSIFLDSRNASDFSDTYSLVYGHHMDHGAMFGAIDAFIEEKYYDNHRTGKLVIGSSVYRLKTFALVEALAEVGEIFELEDGTLEYVRNHAKHLNPEDFPAEEDRYIALSTCKFPDTTERTILFAKLISVKE